MKKVFSTILILIILLLLILPYVVIADYNNRIRELEAQVIMLQHDKSKLERQVRINTQDIDILNNIIYEKDFVKILD